MNIKVKDCFGIAFNSKGDLFFTSENKLSVIRNCTKYPPHPILAPITNVNTKGKYKFGFHELTDKVPSNQTEIEELRKQLEELKKNHKEQLATAQAEKKKLLDELKELETQNKSQKMKLQELEQKLEEKETKEHNGKEILEWLASIKLGNLFSILQDIGVKDLEFLKFLEESDFEGTNIKPLEKRILFQAIKKL